MKIANGTSALGTEGLKFTRASWYGKDFHGKKTYYGDKFNQYGMTFAHNKLPHGTKVKFYYKGKTATGRCTDTGTFGKGVKFDLSRGMARKLGLEEKGVDNLFYEIIPRYYSKHRRI